MDLLYGNVSYGLLLGYWSETTCTKSSDVNSDLKKKNQATTTNKTKPWHTVEDFHVYEPKIYNLPIVSKYLNGHLFWIIALPTSPSLAMYSSTTCPTNFHENTPVCEGGDSCDPWDCSLINSL